jgi:hypothetical protein
MLERCNAVAFHHEASNRCGSLRSFQMWYYMIHVSSKWHWEAPCVLLSSEILLKSEGMTKTERML